ncbi:MAG: hypothetical protein K2Z81_25445 [Cyanobacteria bacterium]|nr:hypothetical protein [Cyanobacteriota bacterium]
MKLLQSGASFEEINRWKGLSEAVKEYRATNAIEYFRINGEVYQGAFREGVKLNTDQLTMLGKLVQEKSKDNRAPMKPGEFQAFLAEYGFNAIPGSKHMKIQLDGGEVSYYLTSEKQLVNATYNAHPHVLQVYQRQFLEGAEWLLVNGQPVSKGKFRSR